MSINPETPSISRRTAPESGRTMACVGCLAALVLAGLASLLLFAIASRDSVPPVLEEWSQRQACIERMAELSQALGRYHNRHQEYPKKLQDLSPEFLPGRTTLRCPLDKAPPGETSYVYIRPKPDAPEDTVVVRCRLHKGMSAGVDTVMEVQLDGNMRFRSSATTTPQSQGI